MVEVWATEGAPDLVQAQGRGRVDQRWGPQNAEEGHAVHGVVEGREVLGQASPDRDPEHDLLLDPSRVEVVVVAGVEVVVERPGAALNPGEAL